MLGKFLIQLKKLENNGKKFLKGMKLLKLKQHIKMKSPPKLMKKNRSFKMRIFLVFKIPCENNFMVN